VANKPIPKGLIPWKKGQSGNPKGRPKKLPNLDKLLIEVLGGTDDESSEAMQILRNMAKRALKSQAAADAILDRAYGKSKTTNEIAVQGEITWNETKTYTAPEKKKKVVKKTAAKRKK
jgi:hypothetical protein